MLLWIKNDVLKKKQWNSYIHSNSNKSIHTFLFDFEKVAGKDFIAAGIVLLSTIC